MESSEKMRVLIMISSPILLIAVICSIIQQFFIKKRDDAWKRCKWIINECNRDGGTTQDLNNFFWEMSQILMEYPEFRSGFKELNNDRSLLELIIGAGTRRILWLKENADKLVSGSSGPEILKIEVQISYLEEKMKKVGICTQPTPISS